MKKIILFVAMIATLFTNTANAQSPTFTTRISRPGSCKAKIQCIVYAISGCTIVGKSYPITVTTTSTTYDYAAISSGPGWNVDPGAPNCTNNLWVFGSADVFDCVGASSSGPALCGGGIFDLASVSLSACSSPSNCFEFSSAASLCGSGCGPGTCATFNLSGGYNCGDGSALDVQINP